MRDALVVLLMPWGMPEVIMVGMDVVHYRLGQGMAGFDRGGYLLAPELPRIHYGRTLSVPSGRDLRGFGGSVVQ